MSHNRAISALGYNGEFLDEVLNQYILGNGYRAYNPALQRFTSPDSMSPFGEGGINPYIYCEGDPINRTDPTGHMDGSRIVKKVAAIAKKAAKRSADELGEGPSSKLLRGEQPLSTSSSLAGTSAASDSESLIGEEKAMKDQRYAARLEALDHQQGPQGAWANPSPELTRVYARMAQSAENQIGSLLNGDIDLETDTRVEFLNRVDRYRVTRYIRQSGRNIWLNLRYFHVEGFRFLGMSSVADIRLFPIGTVPPLENLALRNLQLGRQIGPLYRSGQNGWLRVRGNDQIIPPIGRTRHFLADVQDRRISDYIRGVR